MLTKTEKITAIILGLLTIILLMVVLEYKDEIDGWTEPQIVWMNDGTKPIDTSPFAVVPNRWKMYFLFDSIQVELGIRSDNTVVWRKKQ